MTTPDAPRPASLGQVLRERWDLVLVIGLGGALGSLGRWGVAGAMPHSGADFPWSTLLVNVLGSFLLGSVTVLVGEVWPRQRYLRPFVGVGLLGGFTTFSTYALDARGAHAAGSPAVAMSALVLTLMLAIPAAWAGLRLTRTMVRRRP
ncbi:fluoride efflux transporter FluC [Demetria terragena]|uniref:fluoride efflux transporter FluC n=1 Tax=Demetria terragena TaxID=63959 RepID=UPI0012EA3322|nr:CrcB family protein [Demetria terragena]